MFGGFSPLAGIMLAESYLFAQLPVLLFCQLGFQSPCGDYVSGKEL